MPFSFLFVKANLALPPRISSLLNPGRDKSERDFHRPFFGSTSAAVGRGEEGEEERGERKKPFSSTFRAISRFERGGVGSLPNISRAEIRPQASQKSRPKRGDCPSFLFLPMPSSFYPETFEFSDSRANESSSSYARRRRRG